MSFELRNVVPWGRSADEYLAMFALAEANLWHAPPTPGQPAAPWHGLPAHGQPRRILDCAAGPASFAAEMHARGIPVIAADPIYAHTADEIRQRVLETYPEMIESAHKDRHRFNWTEHIPDPDALGRLRLSAMERFLSDYPAGQRERRYVPDSLPNLSFPDNTFDLALCSHCLFLYSGRLTLDFHLASIRELCRVAHEARIFPLIDLAGRPSQHIEPVSAKLRDEGYTVSIQKVDYEFVKGGNEMLIVRGAGHRFIPSPGTPGEGQGGGCSVSR